MPVHWVGSEEMLRYFGAEPEKTIRTPTVREFERWARKIGAKLVGGAKHPKVILPNGRRCPYTAHQKSQDLYPPEAKKIAAALGLSVRELFEAIISLDTSVA